MNVLRPDGLVDPVVGKPVLYQAHVHEIGEPDANIVPASVNRAFTGDSDILLADGEHYGGPAGARVLDVIPWIEGAKNRRTLLQFEFHPVLQEYGACDVISWREHYLSATLGCNVVYRRLDGGGVDGGAVPDGAEGADIFRSQRDSRCRGKAQGNANEYFTHCSHLYSFTGPIRPAGTYGWPLLSTKR